MSLASRALAPAKSNAKAAASVSGKGVVAGYRSVAGTWNDDRMPLLPFFVYAGVCVLLAAFRAVASAETEVTAGIAFGVCALLALAGAVKAWDGKAEPRVLVGCACVAGLCAWLCAAVTAPASLAIYLVGFAVTCGMGVPYWLYLAAHRKPPAQTVIHMDKPETPVAVSEFDDVKGMQGCEWVSSEKTTPSGTYRPLRLAKGMDARDIIRSKQGAIAGLPSIDARYDDVELVETDRASVIDVFHHSNDLLAKPLPWPMLNTQTYNILADIPIGLYRTNEKVSLNLDGRHLLIGGGSNSGKSVFMSSLAIIATLDPSCDVYLIDGKKVELSFWRHAAKMYCKDRTSDAVNTLRTVQGELDRRYDLMAENGWRKIANSNGRLGPIALFIDELPRFMRDPDASKELKDEFVNRLKDLLDRGRAAGLMVIASAQRPSAKQFSDGDLRAGFTYRICFRTTDADGSRMVLGDGTGADATRLPIEKPGSAFISGATGGPIRQFRSFYIGDADLERLAAMAEAEPYQISTVVPAQEHYDAPRGNDVASESHYPDGSPIPSDWRLTLWKVLDDTPKSTHELVDAVPVGRKPVTDNLKHLASQRFVLGEPSGKTMTWRKA